MNRSVPGVLSAVILALAITACGSTNQPAIGVQPPAVLAPTSVSTTVPLGAAVTTTLPTLGKATNATFSVPASSGTGTLALKASKSFPADLPTLQSLARRTSAIKPLSASTYLTYLSFEFTPSSSVTLSAVPSFSVTFDPGDIAVGTSLYVAYLTGNNGFPTWTNLAGPTTYSGSTFTFTGATTAQPLNAGQLYGLVVYSISSGSPVGSPSAAPSAAPSASASSAPGSSPSSAPSATPKPSPAPTATVVASTNPANVGAYVLGTDANNNPIIRAIAPGAADYSRTLSLPAGFGPNGNIDSDSSGTLYVSSYATVSGGQSGSRLDRYPSGATTSAGTTTLTNAGASILAAAPDGTVYFNSFTTISYVAPNSTTVVNPTPYTLDLAALATDKSGNVYSVQRNSARTTNTMLEYGPRVAGTPRSVSLTFPQYGSVRRMRVGPDGTIYIAISSGASSTPNSIAVIGPTATAASVTTLPQFVAANDFGFDAAGNVYVALTGTANSDGFSVYTTGLASLTRSVVTNDSLGRNVQPTALRADSAGAVYVIASSGGSSSALYIFAPNGTTPQVTTTTGITLAYATALGF